MAQKNASLEKLVNNAVRSFYSQGKTITNETVRAAIGGGSFRDIGPLVKTAKAELAAEEQTTRAAPEMPDDFNDAAAAMLRTAWELADEIATSERRAHAAEIDKLKAEADEALSNCGIVEDERDEAEARAQSFSKELEESRGSLRDAQLEIAKLNGRLIERETDIVSRTKQPKLRRQTAKPSPEKPATSVAAGEEAQPDMFPPKQANNGNSDDPDTIAAE
jgi:hypothetical protein